MPSSGITIICVDSDHSELGALALNRSFLACPGAEAVFLAPFRPRDLHERIKFVRIGPFRSVEEYSMCILSGLRPYVNSSHCLIVQWDGFVINPEAWDDRFLDYDYIGAQWPQFPKNRSVGNGGFSLRSRRLLDALTDPALCLHPPEDICICHTNRELLESRHGIRFAPPDIAAAFAFERGVWNGQTFGFHGLFNFPTMLPDSYRYDLAQVPSNCLSNRDAIDLGAKLLQMGSREDRSIVIRIAIAVLRYRPTDTFRLARRWCIALWQRPA